MRARVPEAVVDNAYELMPTGNYDGAIVSAVIRDPNNDGEWLTLRVSIEGVTSRDGTADTGRDRFQSDLTIRTDGVDLFEVEDFTNGEIPFGIRRAAGLLAGLAEGLGVESRADGAVEVDLRSVTEALIDGQFAGEQVAFEVSHYKGTKPGAKARDQYNRFGIAS